MTNNRSEIALLRARIDLELDALERWMHAPAVVASHTMISRRFGNLEVCVQALARHVGEEQATEELCERYATL